MKRTGRWLARSEGFTMVAVMLALTAVSAIALAGWAASGGDVAAAQRDTDTARAYAAAEAGVAEYLQKLARDNEYWLKCDQVPPLAGGAAAPVNQPWNGTGADPRRWRTLQADPQSEYTIELLPAAGYSACQPNVDRSMLTEGVLRIRTTGRVGPPGRKVKRSLITSLRRSGFLDYIYFTEYETSDPMQLEVQVQATNPAWTRFRRCLTAACPEERLANWAEEPDACAQWVRSGRDSVTYPGYVNNSGAWQKPSPNISCTRIQFANDDTIRGPFHTNDTMQVCGSPQFGRNRNGNGEPVDRVEFWGHRASAGCPNTPDFGANRVVSGNKMPLLKLPSTNSELKAVAGSAYTFTGRTDIVFNGNSMTVNGATRPLPTEGVIYVANHPTRPCAAFTPLDPYASAPDCGDAHIRGTYSGSVTIATERDIVVEGDFVSANGSNALAGLVANNFIRVAHRMAAGSPVPCTASSANAAGTSGDRNVHAAMVSLNHVFTVDNYQCGTELGTLRVLGAIAQKYRGPVGVSRGNGTRGGYVKDYVYDDRFKYRSPPHFTTPKQSTWRIIRSTEMSPAR